MVIQKLKSKYNFTVPYVLCTSQNHYSNGRHIRQQNTVIFTCSHFLLYLLIIQYVKDIQMLRFHHKHSIDVEYGTLSWFSEDVIFHLIRVELLHIDHLILNLVLDEKESIVDLITNISFSIISIDLQKEWISVFLIYNFLVTIK